MEELEEVGHRVEQLAEFARSLSLKINADGREFDLAGNIVEEEIEITDRFALARMALDIIDVDIDSELKEEIEKLKKSLNWREVAAERNKQNLNLSIREAAYVSGFSIPTINNWIKGIGVDDKLQKIQFGDGKNIKINPKVLDKFIDSNNISR